MKKLLIICFIVLFPFYSYGKSIHNKGIICENTTEGFIFVPIWGFWFDQKEGVVFYELTLVNVWEGRNMGVYRVEDFKITFSLSKKSLFEGKILINRNSGKLTNKGSEYGVNFLCNEVIPNKEKFLIRLQKRLDVIEKKRETQHKKEQKKYKDKLNKRKF
jgi:hypothetical protein